MNNDDYIFSWAEDEQGKMVYVDDVPRGDNCGCFCPCCHEKLIAKQGKIRNHHFAHKSAKNDELAQHKGKRGANLEMCYQVSVYKLAEQIIKQDKRLRIPSYYGFFKACDVEFQSVDIDSSYQRIDKQPDVIAISTDGKKYLIEFIFKYKVQHKQKIDYNNLNCLQIDLEGQSLEYDKLENFLIYSNEGRDWVNNQDYFNEVKSRCREKGKPIKFVTKDDCAKCEIKQTCCAAKYKKTLETIVIENNGIKYKLCQQKEFKEIIDQLEKSKGGRGIVNKGDGYEVAARVKPTEVYESELRDDLVLTKPDMNAFARSCFSCIHHEKKGERAFCDCYDDNSKRGFVNPQYANMCKEYCVGINH